MTTERTPPAHERIVAERNRAIACAVLSIAISVALTLSTFLSHRSDLVEAHREIKNLQSSLITTQEALKANEAALLSLQNSLNQLQAGARPSSK